MLPGKRGSVAVLVAVSAPALTMAVALGIEVSGWTVTQQRLQRAADMAAIAGALAYSNGATAQLAATYAAYVAELNGGAGTTSRTWNGTATPPTLSDNLIQIQMTAGIKNTNDKAFVATIQTTVPYLFSAIALHGTGQALSASATAEVMTTTTTTTSQLGKYCILTTDTGTSSSTATAGIDASNGATIDLSQCGIAVNSAGSDALYLTGGASLTATTVSVAGNYAINNGASMTVNGTRTSVNGTPNTVSGNTTTGAAAVSNPYANVTVPTPGSCAATNTYGNGGTFSISPGTFCNGLNIANGATVNMAPGTYIIDNGSFSLQGGATVNATGGVTIVLTGSSGSNVGTAQIANGTTLNLTAPSSGPTSGIAILQDPRASSTADNMAGGSSLNVNGALYFPSSVVDFSNGSSNNATCTQLIAFQVVFEGGARFGNSCTGTGTSAIGPTVTSTSTSTTSLVQ